MSQKSRNGESYVEGRRDENLSKALCGVSDKSHFVAV